VNAQWLALSNRFAAYKSRERGLIAGALALAIGFGGYTLWVEPGRQRSDIMEKQISQQQTEIAVVDAQVSVLKSQLKDPDAANRTAFAEVRRQLATAEKELHLYDGILVRPDQVPQLLQSLLGRHRGLSLLSLQSIDPVPLLPPPEKKDDKAPPAPSGNIYKHGIEIKLAGGYLDLLDYVAELEHAPQKLLWGKMNLTVTAYPRSELALTVYTLSLDQRWLVL
jgi:MSHA biogenesis protein MshJ